MDARGQVLCGLFFVVAGEELRAVGSGLHLDEVAIGDGFTQRREVKSVCPVWYLVKGAFSSDRGTALLLLK